MHVSQLAHQVQECILNGCESLSELHPEPLQNLRGQQYAQRAARMVLETMFPDYVFQFQEYEDNYGNITFIDLYIMPKE